MAKIMRIALALWALVALTGATRAQEVVLRAHHFLPVNSTTHADILVPWKDAVEAQSQGRIAVEIYPSMQLGGRPPQLFDQARDGVVDIAWTLLGYTPGRFPLSEAFELPFVTGTAVEITQALQDHLSDHLGAELGATHVLALHAPAAYTLHLRDRRVATRDDLSGLKIRAPSRAMTAGLGALGAVAVGMPVPEVPQALSTGVIDGAALPWEVVGSLRIEAVARDHVEFGAPGGGMGSSVMALVMNRGVYERLAPELRAVIDANSGAALARKAAEAFDRREAMERAKAVAAGDRISIIAQEDLPDWRAAAQPAIDQWAAQVEAQGHDAAAILAAARAALARARGE